MSYYVNTLSMLALAVFIFLFCTFLVSLRLISRHLQKISLGKDDYFMLLSYLLTVSLCALMLAAVGQQRWGEQLPPPINATGQVDYLWSMSPEFSQSEEFYLVEMLLFGLQITAAKLSILFYYRRMLCFERRGFLHWASMALIVLTILWGLVVFFMYLFQCGPDVTVYYQAPMAIQETKCMNELLDWSISVTDVSIDVLIFVLPMHRIFTLGLPLQKKFLVAGLFAIGAGTIVVSSVRLVLFTEILYDTGESWVSDLDVNILASTLAFWVLFESGIAVVTACLPSIQFLLKDAKGFAFLKERVKGSWLPSLSKVLIIGKIWKASYASSTPSFTIYAGDMEPKRTFGSSSACFSADMDSGFPVRGTSPVRG